MTWAKPVRGNVYRLIGAGVEKPAYCGPDRIFQCNVGRASSRFGRDIGRNGVWPDDPNRHFPISEVSVATTVASANSGAHTGNVIDLHEHAGTN